MRDDLESLRQRLAGFELSQCGMQHEQIQRVPGSEIPERDASVDHGFKRSQYCSGTVRRRRLACAHTMARTDFESILDALPRKRFAEKQIGDWKNTLQELDQLIIQVDWEKSDAELQHARQCDALHEAGGEDAATRQAVERTDQEIQALIDRHDEYVVRLQKLRDEVLAAVVAAKAVEEGQRGC